LGFGLFATRLFWKSGRARALGRFGLYKQWLEEEKYPGYVMISDTRDALFQTNPFAAWDVGADEPVIELATEFGWDSPEDRAADIGKGQGSTIGESGWTRGWIGNCFGSKASDKVANEKVLCSGTTAGTAPGMQIYLQVMVDEIAKRVGSDAQKEAEASGLADAAHCRDYGVDQGFHNYVMRNIAHTNLKLEVPKYGSKAATFLTTGQVCSPPPSKREKFQEETGRDHSWEGPGDISRDAKGYALREDGSRAPVVHQWDRCWVQFRDWIETELMK